MDLYQPGVVLPERMSGDLVLVAQDAVEGVVDDCASNRLGCLCEHGVKTLHAVAVANADELEDWLVVFESNCCLATWLRVRVRTGNREQGHQTSSVWRLAGWFRLLISAYRRET